MTTLSELADAVEGLEGPSMKHDILIENACVEPTGQPKKWLALKYTASIDAALTLVPEGMSFEVRRSGTGDQGQATIWNPMRIPGHPSEVRVRGCSSPALALCAAALRARASGEGA